MRLMFFGSKKVGFCNLAVIISISLFLSLANHIHYLKSEFKYTIEENNIPEQLQRLEVTLNEWDEAKLNLLMSNKTPHFNHLNEAPNPYKVEVEKNSQYLRRVRF